MRKFPLFAIFSLLISFLLLATGYIVLASFFISFALCVITGCFGIKGLLPAVLAVAAAVLYFLGTAKLQISYMILALTIPASFLMGISFYKSRGFAITVLPAALAETFIIALLIYIRMKTNSVSAVSAVFGERVLNAEVFKSMLPSEFDVDSLIKLIYVELDLLMPLFIVLLAGTACIITYLVTLPVVERHSVTSLNLPSFSEFYLGRSFSTIYMFFLIVMLFVPTGPITMNVYMVLSVMFMICGLSVCSFYLKKTSIPNVFRILIVVFIGVISMMIMIPSTLLGIVGLIDSSRNFRHLQFEKGKIIKR